jgi:hypothetical protein
MRAAIALILALTFAVPSLAKNFGGIEVAGVGTVYVVGPDWTSDFIRMEGDGGFSLVGGGRVYFASNPDDGLNAGSYWQVCTSF